MEAEKVNRYMKQAGMVKDDLGEAAEIIGRAMDLAVREEREACAKACNEEAKGYREQRLWHAVDVCLGCTEAVRARGAV